MFWYLFLGKKNTKIYNIYFIGSSQMELNVFSLCIYGQLATNLGKRDRTLNHPTNTETSLKHNCILNLYSRSRCGEEGEAALQVYCQDKNHHKEDYGVMLSVKKKKKKVSWPCKYNYSCWKWICKDTNKQLKKIISEGK